MVLEGNVLMNTTKEKRKTLIKFSEFKGKNILNIFNFRDDGATYDKPALSFGVGKAKMILDNIEEIKKFVKENEE